MIACPVTSNLGTEMAVFFGDILQPAYEDPSRPAGVMHAPNAEGIDPIKMAGVDSTKNS